MLRVSETPGLSELAAVAMRLLDTLGSTGYYVGDCGSWTVQRVREYRAAGSDDRRIAVGAGFGCSRYSLATGQMVRTSQRRQTAPGLGA